MLNYYVRCKATSSGLEVKAKPPKNKAYVEEVAIKTSDGGIHHMLAHSIPGRGEELKWSSPIQVMTVQSYVTPS